jgi:hypothetical protein
METNSPLWTNNSMLCSTCKSPKDLLRFLTRTAVAAWSGIEAGINVAGKLGGSESGLPKSRNTHHLTSRWNTSLNSSILTAQSSVQEPGGCLNRNRAHSSKLASLLTFAMYVSFLGTSSPEGRRYSLSGIFEISRFKNCLSYCDEPGLTGPRKTSPVLAGTKPVIPERKTVMSSPWTRGRSGRSRRQIARACS